MDLQILNRLVLYDSHNGALYTRSKNRLLTADEFGMVTIYDNLTKKKFKMKYAVVCWMLAHQKVLPKDHKVLHKNLDEFDFRLRFLKAVHRDLYNRIQEAVRNLDGGLKVIQHPEDQYSYILKYQLDGVERREVIYDITAAKKREMRLRLKFAKIITANCLFE